MKKFLIIIFLLLIFPKSSFAADLEITCNSTTCTPPTPSAFFTTSDSWYPGMSLVKSIRVLNDSPDTLTFYNKTQNNSATGSIDDVLDFKIDVYGGINLFDDKISSLYLLPSTPLVTLSANSSALLLYAASMPVSLGNEYQDKQTVFDLVLNFTGGAPDDNPSNPGTPSNTSTPFVCNATSPSPLQNLRVIGSSANTATLAWNSVTPVTHYALIFTRLRDGAKYGSANIGNIGSYTINNLSGGESYEFEIFGVNDCAPGSSAKVTQSITGVVIEGRPIGQGGEVLGTNTASESGITITSFPTTLEPEVLGDESSICQDPWWRTLFLFAIVGLLILTQVFIGFQHRKTNLFLITLLYLIFFIVNFTYFCVHPLWPALIFLAHFIYVLFFLKRFA